MPGLRLSRHLLRPTPLASTLTPPPAAFRRRLLPHLKRHSSTHVPVVSYTGGHRNQADITVATPQPPPGPLPLSTAAVDEATEAQPLDPGTEERLPPTLRRFCLRGKVAVVTG